MKTLTTVHLVQFSFWEYESFKLSRGGTAFIGPNGAGKTSLVDAIQVAMVGGHGQYLQFNSQSVHKDSRSLRDYALGVIRSGDGGSGITVRKRNEALSYITLLFEGERDEDVISAGICLWASEKEAKHRVLGLYVLPGVRLKQEDHLLHQHDGSVMPLDWTEFDRNARRLAGVAGRTPTIGTKPDAYLDELLHQISDQAQSIDPRKFLRALKQSIKLKEVNSVNDFLRENLVSATKVDRKGTLLHIQRLRDLSLQIEEVRKQIVSLDSISDQYTALHKWHQTKAVAQATLFKIKSESEQGALKLRLRRKEDYVARSIAAQERIGALQEGKEAALQAYSEALATFNADPEAAAPEHARQVLEARSDVLRQMRKEVDRLDSLVADALHHLARCFDGSFAEHARDVREKLGDWDARRGEGAIASEDSISSILSFLEAKMSLVSSVHGDRDDLRRQRKREAQTALAKLEAANGGHRIKDDDVADAVQLFSRSGIRCHLAASGVKVKDRDWQGAIETFLGRNRLALVIEDGQERSAVRLLRAHKISGVTVIQPTHLADSIGVVPDAGSVAALLQSSDAVALAFFARILGKMRCVATEEELERHPRALTNDYMLSANGGTRRLRPLETKDYLLGVTVNDEDLSELKQAVLTARQAEVESETAYRTSELAMIRASNLTGEVSSERYRLAAKECLIAAENVARSTEAAASELPDRLKRLKEIVASEKQRMKNLEHELEKANAEHSQLNFSLERLNSEIGASENLVGQLLEQWSVARHDQDYDEDQANTRMLAIQCSDADSVARE